MDVRKTLVELLREAPYNIFGNKLGNYYFDSCLELIADHLIANGVTVQEDCKDCPYRTEPITNADRIRAMSDEELADMLWKTCRNYRAVCADPVVDYNEHRDGLIAWLKQPAGQKGD